MSEDEADAVALFRPVRPEALKPFLDLDEESENSEGIYAEALEDGSFLLHTFQPFSVFAESPHEVIAWLEQFGDALDEVHDDPRGLLFFPDSIEPEATTYDGVVAAAEAEGIWIPLSLPPGIDMEQLQALAGQLLGAVPGPDGKMPAASSFDIGKMFEGMQGHLAEAFGLPQGKAPEDEAPPSEPKDPKPTKKE